MNIEANNSMNSDWEKLRRFAMQLSQPVMLSVSEQNAIG